MFGEMLVRGPPEQRSPPRDIATVVAILPPVRPIKRAVLARADRRVGRDRRGPGCEHAVAHHHDHVVGQPNAAAFEQLDATVTEPASEHARGEYGRRSWNRNGSILMASVDDRIQQYPVVERRNPTLGTGHLPPRITATDTPGLRQRPSYVAGRLIDYRKPTEPT